MIADSGTGCDAVYAQSFEVLPGIDGDVQGARDPALGRERSPDAADAFAAARGRFEEIVGWLGNGSAAGLEHAELETRLELEGRALLRVLLQDHLDLRAVRERRVDEVIDRVGVARGAVEPGHRRPLGSVFGEVTVTRLAYRRRGCENLHVADAVLNLPCEQASHGVRRMAAIASARGSFDEARCEVRQRTGLSIGKHQVEQLARRAACDFDSFYAGRARADTDVSGQDDSGQDDSGVLVLSADGKGIVMRPDALRTPTAKAAAGAQSKLRTRLSKGEKRYRKRIAEVGAVYEIASQPRTSVEVLAARDEKTMPAPKARNKWLTASIVQDAATVVGEIFDEADRRDPDHTRTWVALVDGNNHQIDRIEHEATNRGVNVAIVVDFVHVLEYLWGAAWCFHTEADPAAEAWVHDKALAVLNGKAGIVAASIRRTATRRSLDPDKRAKADRCAAYLHNKKPYLDYPTALAAGWPIATGVIEGACRHLVKDRLDITGARWGLDGAEAVLKLRALRSNDDFDDYWTHHLAQERNRVHETRYAHSVIPTTT